MSGQRNLKSSQALPHTMPSVTSTVTVTADDGSSTTTTITETATGEAAFPISPSLSPSMGFGGVMTTFVSDPASSPSRRLPATD